ncbi:MAG: hypothetical protein WBG50_00290 [Desulfomonilaceae bacterium]
MDYSLIIILVLLIAGVGGFAILALVLLSNWKAGSRGHEEVDAYQSKKTRDFENCFNDCMIVEHWDPDRTELCRSLCR